MINQTRPAGSLSLVDPGLRAAITPEHTVDFNAAILPLVRAPGRRAPIQFEDASDKVSKEERLIKGPPGAPDVPITLYRPMDETGPMPCILHIHGGGFVAGSAAREEPVTRPMAAELKCVIVSVDYRLAPETQFPGAIEDCYAVLAWIIASAAEMGIDSSNIGVLGASAGGGLAAALALMVRDRGEFQLKFQHLIYPMLDDRTGTLGVLPPYAGEFIWTPASNHFGWSSLLGHAPGIDGVSAYAAPARATDLSGLPPTYISTGSLDLFFEEDIDFARRLNRAGVPVELQVYPGGVHGFDVFFDVELSRRARADRVSALRRALQLDAQHPALI